jgi:hypothetical protein
MPAASGNVRLLEDAQSRTQSAMTIQPDLIALLRIAGAARRIASARRINGRRSIRFLIARQCLGLRRSALIEFWQHL